MYHREWSEPSYFQKWKKFNIEDVEQPKDLVERKIPNGTRKYSIKKMGIYNMILWWGLLI